jgi:hypothetical protein
MLLSRPVALPVTLPLIADARIQHDLHALPATSIAAGLAIYQPAILTLVLIAGIVVEVASALA